MRLPLSSSVGQRRRAAVHAAGDPVADDEVRRRGAVVGAARVVVLGPAPELRERHERDPGLEGRGERVEERADRRVEVGHQIGVVRRLVRVGVEAAEVAR